MNSKRKITGDKILGEKIAKLRARKGWSGNQLALAAGLIQSQIDKWEKGLQRIASDQLFAVAKALGVSCDYLVDPEQVEPPPVPLGEQQKRVWQIASDLGWDLAYEVFLERMRAVPGKPLPAVRRGGPIPKDPISEDTAGNP